MEVNVYIRNITFIEARKIVESHVNETQKSHLEVTNTELSLSKKKKKKTTALRTKQFYDS